MKIDKIWLVFFLFCNGVFAKNLCEQQEKVIFAFESRNGKILSLCKAQQGNYLVYRFGVVGAVEFQFPKKLDAGSWNAFEFSGQKRVGLNNAGFGDYSISFSNGAAEYSIFQEWDIDEKIYSIGVNIVTSAKKTTINGVKKTRRGRWCYWRRMAHE
jgi:hypothetical protein